MFDDNKTSWKESYYFLPESEWQDNGIYFTKLADMFIPVNLCEQVTTNMVDDTINKMMGKIRS